MTATNDADTVDHTLDDAIALLWVSARTTALERVGAIESYLAHRLSGAGDTAQYEAAHAAAHKLAGTLGTFGLARGSELARGIELALEDPSLEPDTYAQLASDAIALRELIDGAETTTTTETPTEHVVVPGGSVLIVGAMRSLLEAVDFEARRRGLAVHHTERLASDLELRDAVVLIDGEGDPAAGLDIRRATDRGAAVVVTGVADDITVRAALAGAGADVVLPTGSRPVAVVDAIEHVLAERQRAVRVDVIDTDTSAASALASELAACGLDAGTLSSLAPLAAGPRFQDAVVLGPAAAPERMVDLVRMLRSDPRWDAVALVALVEPDEDNPDDVHMLMTSGVDDVVDARRSPHFIAERVRAAARRHRVQVMVLQSTPAVREQTDDSDSAAASAPVADTGRLLVVDDDETITELLEHVLAERGYEIEVLHDGIAAADRLTDDEQISAYDAVLLDVSLPGLDGFGVLRAMRDAGTLQSLPVVMLTARVREEEVLEAWELGATDHVAKPFSVPVLLHRVEAARARARAR